MHVHVNEKRTFLNGDSEATDLSDSIRNLYYIMHANYMKSYSEEHVNSLLRDVTFSCDFL